MKRSIFCLLVMAGLIMAGVPAIAMDMEFSASLDAYSSYIWRGFRLSEEALQWQPSVTMTLCGFSANVWAEYDTDSDEWLEVDYTAAYARSFDRLSLEIGYSHFDVRNGIDSDEAYLTAAYDCLLNPHATVYADVNEGTGVFLVAGIGHSIELTSWAGLDLGASASMIADNGYVATDAAGNEFTGLFNGEVTVTGIVTPVDWLTVSPVLGYTMALSDDASDAIKRTNSDGDDSFLYGGVNMTIVL
ncbi:hypothetical protein JXA80_03230 [bacterium]|nr:hypothetical protein [candidate division CSSED10-310 bacterium]